MRVLILALALAACAQEAPTPADEAPIAQASDPQANMAAMPQWDQARAAGVDFRGIGQEPGWMIDIYQQDRILLLLDYGQTLTEFSLPSPTSPQDGVTRYETEANGKTLVVTIRRFPCQDAMSGEAFPSTVEVIVGDRTLNGCGRSV
jgi:uncharacterized membrane protein